MAVCKLFNEISNNSGNFLMFTQYTEDLTKMESNKDDYKVVPSKFIALNIDYSNVDNSSFVNTIQNYYENACAWYRDSDEELTPEETGNLFWRAMSEHTNPIILNSNQDNNKIGLEIKFIGDINIQSYNVVNGVGYDEIYCYIPADAKELDMTDGKITINADDKDDDNYTLGTLVGHSTIITDITKYNKTPFYTIDMNMDNPSYTTNKYFDINTIVVLYDVEDGVGNVIHENIPMGIYTTGVINNGVMGNPIHKIVTSESDTYGIGSSYGLRICTRYVSGEETQVTIDNISDEHSSMSEVMGKMGLVLDKMLDIEKKLLSQDNKYKELYSVFKDGRVNVPYVKTIGEKSYWCVNGRILGDITVYGNYATDQTVQETVSKAFTK